MVRRPQKAVWIVRGDTIKAKTDTSNDENLLADAKHKAYNRNNPALDKKGSRTRWSNRALYSIKSIRAAFRRMIGACVLYG